MPTSSPLMMISITPIDPPELLAVIEKNVLMKRPLPPEGIASLTAENLKMFCPKCKSEFIDGIGRCPECDVDLIEALPKAPAPEFVDYKEVLSTYNPADIAFLKSLLESEGIQYFFKGEHFMYVRPLADPARLMIRVDQVAQAIELLKEVKLSFTGMNLDKKNGDR